MSDAAKETVIVVHGTWAAPKSDKTQWYQPIEGSGMASGFVGKLNNALQERGSPARCWAHCTPENQFFRWSGENSWIARMQAASALAAYVRQLQSEGWRCHVVAHSHGGNVVVDALSQITAADQAGPPLKIVTLGTPFIDLSSPVSERRSKAKSRWAAFLNDVRLSVLVVLGTTIALPIAHGFRFFKLLEIFFTQALFFIGIAAAFRLAAAIWFRFFWKSAPTGHLVGEAVGIESRLLALGSRMDEPWQVLHHIRSINNPLAVSTNLMRYVFSSLRLRMNAAADADAALGAKSIKDLGPIEKALTVLIWCGDALLSILIAAFLTWLISPGGRVIALFIVNLLVVVVVHYLFLQYTRDREWQWYNEPFWGPGRWQAHLFGGLLGLPTDVLTYLIRRKSWSVLVAIAMGLEHYRFELPRVEQRPNLRSNCIATYEDLPTSVLERAMLRRGDWIERHLGDVSKTFEKLFVTSADLSSLLRMVEEDQSLIHASYYTDDECIAQIADWIASTG